MGAFVPPYSCFFVSGRVRLEAAGRFYEYRGEDSTGTEVTNRYRHVGERIDGPTSMTCA